MVRYDQCVESLYDGALVDDRTKALQIIKVMKGAISMSKSRTGECIFRTNKAVKKDLERLVKIEVRNSNYNISRIDTNKKFVVDRWTRMLESHTTCSPQTLFEEVLGLVKPGTHQATEKDDSQKLKSLLDLRLEKLNRETTSGGFTPRSQSKLGQSEGQSHDLDDKGENETNITEDHKQFVTERKEIRNRYMPTSTPRDIMVTAPKSDGAILAKSSKLHLPEVSSLRREVTYAPTRMTSSLEEDSSRRPLFERDLTDWNNWALKDKSWITNYIHREKTKHEDLIIRNALTKIENEMSGANMIKRHQLRQKMQNDHNIREIEEQKKQRMRKNREKARELLKMPSASELSVKSDSQVRKKKHVEFSEHVENMGEHSPRTQSIKSKTFHVTLPLIAETTTGVKNEEVKT